MQGWQSDKDWADGHFGEIERIIRRVAGQIIEIREATPSEDMHQATDYVIRVDSGDIGCRIRRAGRGPWRDLTIRSSRPRTGNVTELEKVRSGWGRWYLYGWSHEGRVAEWIFIDLNTLRSSGLLDTAKSKSNHDGSSDFIYIPWQQLHDAGCCIDGEVFVPD